MDGILDGAMRRGGGFSLFLLLEPSTSHIVRVGRPKAIMIMRRNIARGTPSQKPPTTQAQLVCFRRVLFLFLVRCLNFLKLKLNRAGLGLGLASHFSSTVVEDEGEESLRLSGLLYLCSVIESTQAHTFLTISYHHHDTIAFFLSPLYFPYFILSFLPSAAAAATLVTLMLVYMLWFGPFAPWFPRPRTPGIPKRVVCWSAAIVVP
jgi:hypothetical protein